jgi:hypothetical protein
MTLPKSRIFGATVGCSVPAASSSKDDYLIGELRMAGAILLISRWLSITAPDRRG